jgi:PAS domain S-box-containing protein
MALTFWSFSQMKEAVEARKHTSNIIISAATLLSELKDAETGERGFLLTGDESFLQPYMAAQENIHSNLEDLHQLSKIPAAHQHLEAISPIVDAKLAELSQVIELRRKHDTTAAVAIVSEGQNKRLMDVIRDEMQSFIKLEQDARAEHEEALQSNLQILFILMVCFSLAALLSAFAFAYFINRQTQQRLKNLVHAQTVHLLESQQESNKQLHQSNIALQENEEKLAVTLHSIGDAVIATDVQARVTLLNPIAERLTGWTNALAAGRPIDEVFHIINKDTRQLSTIPVMETLAHGTLHGLANHTVLIARDGSERDIADSCAPIKDRDDRVIGAVLVFRDVTEEYALQHALSMQQEELETQNEKLRENEGRFRTLADNISQLAWMADAQGSLFWYNKRWLDYTGTTLEEMHGWGWQKVHHPDHELRVVEKFKHSLETGEAWEDTFPLRGADGQYRWFLSRALPIRDEQGRVLRWFGTNTDITEHRQAEEALQNIKQKLATTMGLSQLFDWEYDVTSGFFTFSDNYYSLHDTTAEQEGGNRISAVDFSRKFMHPDDAQTVGEEINRAVETTDPLYRTKTETRILTSNGNVRYVWVVFFISKNAAGQTLKLHGVSQDVTERKMLEMERDALNRKIKSTALQDAIFNSSNFSSIATDAKGVIQIFNVGAERMLGYSAVDVMNIITPAEISDPQEVIERANTLSAELDTKIMPGFEALVFKASRGIEDIYELTYIRKDGSRFPAIVSVTALRDAQGLIIGYLLIGTDNTARKQAEEALLTAGALQKAIFDSANFSSIATDAKGVIQIFNVGAEHMLGYSATDVMNKITPADISDPQEVITRAQTLSAELDTQIKPGFEALVFKASRGIEDIYELTYIRKDGSRFPAVVSVTALRDTRDAIIGYLLIGTDNTARKLVEAERVQLFITLQENNIELATAKVVAEKASLAKSVFLSSMSHELRTPLNAILGFAQLLHKGPPTPTDAQLIKLQQVIKAGWYLLELINEILDLAVIESGKIVLSHEAVSLAEVMHECQGMIEEEAKKRGIHIDFLPIDNAWYIYADRTRLKQALINLLTNSVKYNRERGMVVVKCTCTPQHIRICIKDSGEGLSPEKLSQLFQPFNRLGQENGSEEGTGIGLVVTKQVIELMGGTISVKSTVGLGCEFLIELARVVAPQLAAGNTLAIEIGSQAHASAAIHTLLYVEDNPSSLMLVEQIIGENSQIRMLSAINAEIGIALARAHQPDLILMDINLPGISGVEALAILRHDSETAHIPVIALSANAMPRDIEKGLEAGFFRYITKPIKLNEFTEALDAAIASAGQKQPSA